MLARSLPRSARTALAACAMFTTRVLARSHHLAPRQPAPSFTLPSVTGTELTTTSLESLRGSWVVLFSYPLDHTFVCPTELLAFNDRLSDFEAINTKLLALSIDSKYSHLSWNQQPRNKGGLGGVRYPLLADVGGRVSKMYGLLIEDEADGDYGVTWRGTVIIDPTGTIRHYSLSDLPVGRSVDEVIRLLTAFQYSDKHGEVRETRGEGVRVSM